MIGIEAALLVSGTSEELSRFVPAGQLRRLDTVTREALLAICLVLEKHEAAAGPFSGEDTGLVVATEAGPVELSRKFLQDIIVSGDEFASPTHFSSSVHNALAGQVSLLKKITGPVRTLSAGPDSFSAALASAEAWISGGLAGRVLVVGCDEQSPLHPLMDPETADRPAGAIAWLLGPVSERAVCLAEVGPDGNPAGETAVPATAFGRFLDVHKLIEAGIEKPVSLSDRFGGFRVTLLPAG
jgi:hypothetical protein